MSTPLEHFDASTGSWNGVEPLSSAVHGVIGDMQAAIASVVDVTHADTANISEFAAGFDVHKKISWQVINILQADDPLGAARFVPSRRAMSTFLRAAERKGVEQSQLDRVTECIDRFESIIEQYSDDREHFDMLIASSRRPSNEEADKPWRKSAYNGNAYILGAHTRVKFNTLVLGPSSQSENPLECLALRGHVRFRSIRQDTPWLISKIRSVDDNGVALTSRLEPLSSQTGPEDPPFLPEYCSPEVPRCSRRVSVDGFVEHWLEPGQVGNAGSQSFVIGERGYLGFSQFKNKQESIHSFGATVDVPCEWLIVDQVVHESLWPEMRPEVAVLSDCYGSRSVPLRMRLRDRLPIDARVEYRGRGVAALFTPHAKQYVELVSDSIGRCGWKADEFEVYRIVIQYPPMPSTVVMYHNLPSK